MEVGRVSQTRRVSDCSGNSPYSPRILGPSSHRLQPMVVDFCPFSASGLRYRALRGSCFCRHFHGSRSALLTLERKIERRDHFEKGMRYSRDTRRCLLNYPQLYLIIGMVSV